MAQDIENKHLLPKGKNLMSFIDGFPSPSHSHDITATSEISTAIHYGVNGRVPFGDFEDEVKVLVRDWVKSKWSASPAVSTNPPNDFKDCIRFGDYDYDSFSTYYIKVSEDLTRFDNTLVSQGMLGFITPVLFKLT